MAHGTIRISSTKLEWLSEPRWFFGEACEVFLRHSFDPPAIIEVESERTGAVEWFRFAAALREKALPDAKIICWLYGAARRELDAALVILNDLPPEKRDDKRGV